MKKTLYLVVIMVIVLTFFVIGCSSDKNAENTTEFKYYTAEQLKQSIIAEKPVIIVDIQVKEEFNKHHIKGAIPTYAYPVKSAEDKAKLEKILPELKKSDDPIVIVCPRGAGGAERTYKYFADIGIDKNRLYILENGQAGWPYDELLEK